MKNSQSPEDGGCHKNLSRQERSRGLSSKTEGRTQAKLNKGAPQKAVAIQYTDSASLPEVIASGIGNAAERIIELAKTYEIPIEENNSLVEMLSGVRPGSEINPDSFQLVAEVLAFLYHVDRAWNEEHQFLSGVLGPSLLETK